MVYSSYVVSFSFLVLALSRSQEVLKLPPCKIWIVTVGFMAPGVHFGSGIGKPLLVLGEQLASADFSVSGVDAVGSTPAGQADQARATTNMASPASTSGTVGT